MNKCFVTKLKGTVNNNNLNYYSFLTIDVIGDGTFCAWSMDGNIDYKSEGITIVLSGTTLPASGSFPNNAIITVTGTGKLFVGNKYRFTSMACSSNLIFKAEDICEEYMLNEDGSFFGLVMESTGIGKIFDTLNGKHLNYKGKVPSSLWCRLPLILDMNYSGITYYPATNETNEFAFNYYDVKQTLPDINPAGDICNIVSITGLPKKLKEITISNDMGDMYVSNIDLLVPFMKDVAFRFVVPPNAIKGGDIIESFKQMSLLTNIGLPGDYNLEWAPVFNAWKAAGKRDVTVAFYAPGCTINSVSGYRRITFDANGNWTPSTTPV